MNQRIRQLAIEAGYEKDMFGIGHWDMPECQKFAELIVRECAGQVDWILAEGGGTQGDLIREHFGVEP
jgi:hypothetical protein